MLKSYTCKIKNVFFTDDDDCMLQKNARELYEWNGMEDAVWKRKKIRDVG